MAALGDADAVAAAERLALAAGVVGGLGAPPVVAGVPTGRALAGGGAVGAAVGTGVGSGVGAGVDAATTVTLPVIDGWIAQW